MTDVGRYATVTAAIVTAIGTVTIDSVTAEVKPYRRVESLLGPEGVRKPVIGVARRKMVDLGQAIAIGSREWEAHTVWEVAIVAQSLRGKWDAEPWVDKVLETLHDSLQNLAISESPSLLRALSDEYMDSGEPAIVAAVSSWSLPMILGH